MSYKPYEKIEIEFTNGMRRKVQRHPSGKLSWVIPIDGVYTNITGEDVNGVFHPKKEEHRRFIEGYAPQREPRKFASKAEFNQYYKKMNAARRDKYSEYDRDVTTSLGVRKVNITRMAVSMKRKTIKVRPNHEKKCFELIGE